MRLILTSFLSGLLAAICLPAPATLANGVAAPPGAASAVSTDAVTAAPAEAEVPEGVPADPQTADELLALPPEARSAVPVQAGEADLSGFLWQNRVLVIFADTAEDLNFLRQMDLIRARALPLRERGVVVLVDSEPAAGAPIRKKLRPRGFAAVLVDKDGRVISRRPSPWDVREIERAIDSTPLRLQELREHRDAIDPMRSGNR